MIQRNRGAKGFLESFSDGVAANCAYPRRANVKRAWWLGKPRRGRTPQNKQNKKAQGPTSAEKRQLKGKTKAKLGHSPQLSSSCYLAGEVLNYGLGD